LPHSKWHSYQQEQDILQQHVAALPPQYGNMNVAALPQYGKQYSHG
jgi:murein tripeptide amidase MpaA